MKGHKLTIEYDGDTEQLRVTFDGKELPVHEITFSDSVNSVGWLRFIAFSRMNPPLPDLTKEFGACRPIRGILDTQGKECPDAVEIVFGGRP